MREQVRQEKYDRQERPKRDETQNTENKILTEVNSSAPMLRPKERNNVESIKKAITKKKRILPSLRNQDWKKFKVETKNVNKLLNKIDRCSTPQNK